MAWYNTDNLELLYAPHKRDWRAEAFKKIKKVAIDVAKRSAVFRKASRRFLLDERMGGYQKRTAHIVTDPKVVLFSTFDGRGYSDSPKAIYEYMCSDPRFADYTFVWAFREPKKFTYVLDHLNTYIVTVNTPAYEDACARAKYWFFNYRIADHIYPKDDQVYVQLWHGTPLKRLGYDISISDNAMNSKEEIRQKYKVDAEKFKYILAPSAFAAEKFISAWNLQAVGKADTVLEAGYPRNDFLINHTLADEVRIKRELGLPADKKVILYAPTWRDNQHDAKLGYVYRTHMDFDALRREFGDDYVILFRAHYLVANSFDFKKYKGFVYDACGVTDINRLYVVADVLITDYSSVFFDYANLHRPMLFYMYDLASYAGEIRGFYIDLDCLPGPIVETQADLHRALHAVEADKPRYAEKYAAFNARFNYLDDGHAAQRVVERVVLDRDGADVV